MDRQKFIPKSRVVDRMAYLADLATGKKVLNIGMGGYIDTPEQTAKLALKIGDTVQGKLHRTADELTGIDINPMSIEIMAEALPGRYIVTDIAAPDAVALIDDKYDLIVFGDVIEHLDCFRDALNNLRELLKEDGELVITTVNAYCAESILKYVFRYEAVHDEHTCYFSYMTMKRLLHMNDLALSNFGYYKEPRKPKSIASWLGYIFHSFVMAFMPHFATGIVVHAKPK